MPSSDPQLDTQTAESEVPTDGQSQDQLRKLFIEQQRRLSCASCGEPDHVD